MANHSTILDLLEIPQLMDTYVLTLFSLLNVTLGHCCNGAFSLELLDVGAQITNNNKRSNSEGIGSKYANLILVHGIIVNQLS